MNTAAMPSVAGLTGLQSVLLWACIIVGVLGCALILFVTVRHRLRLLAGATVVDLPADTRGAPPHTGQVGGASSAARGHGGTAGHSSGGMDGLSAGGPAGAQGVVRGVTGALPVGDHPSRKLSPHAVHGEVDGYATGPTTLLSEIIWVVVPLVMMLGLGGWVVAQLW